MSELLDCPFCGSSEIDDEWWLSGGERHGPTCEDCGASAESAEGWNRRAEPGWQPISSAPRDGEFVLAWMVHEGNDYCPDPFQRCDLIYWDAGCANPGWERKPGWAAHWIGTPTYWMPLPNPPVEAPSPAHAELSPGNSSDLRGEEG